MGVGSNGTGASAARRHPGDWLTVRVRVVAVVTVSVLLATGLGLAAWVGAQHYSARRDALAALDAHAVELAGELAGGLTGTSGRPGAPADPQARLDAWFGARPGGDAGGNAAAYAAALYAPDGSRLARHHPAGAPAALTLPATLPGPAGAGRTVTDRLAFVVQPLTTGTLAEGTVLLVARALPGVPVPDAAVLALALGVAVAGVLIALVLAGTVLAPLRRVTRFATQAAGHTLGEARLSDTGHDDLARLRRAINALLDGVSRQERRLHQSQAALEDRVFERTRELEQEIARREQAQRERETAMQDRELIMENVQDIIFALDARGLLSSFNRRLNAATGLASAQLLGKPLTDCVAEPDRAACAEAMTRAAREGIGNVECRLEHADGTARYYEITARSLHDGQDRPVGVTGIARDVTARRAAEARARELTEALEQRVAERTAQLETLNRELESFSYTVSHDLRAPLRSIEGFSRAIEEDFAAQLPPAGRDYLARVRAAAQRMDGLIDGLLGLSRVSRADMHVRALDLSELARRICETMAQEDPDRAVSVHVAPGMQACADSRLVDIALENLLRNAWKFTARTAQAEIEVGVRAEPSGPVFFVRDNGAGFDPAAASALFSAFGRLHRDDEFPGTGIGLATVQRIVTRHGGRIWAQAQPGAGATFFFTLPAPHDEPHDEVVTAAAD